MEIKTICHLFFDLVDNYPEHIIFKYKKDGVYVGLKAGEVKETVENLANGLMALGTKPDSKIAIISHNRVEWVLADLAIVTSGGVTASIYPTLLGHQAAYIINDSDAEVIFVENMLQFEKIESVWKDCPNLKYIVVMDNTKVDKENVMTFDELIEKGKEYKAKHPDEYRERWESRKPEDLLTLIYTSGTTGDPKGVMLTHSNLVSNVKDSTTHVLGDRLKPGRLTALSFLPLSHSLERMAGYYLMLYNGATIAFAESIDTVAENMLEVRPTCMVSVPRLYEKIYAKVLDTALSSGGLKKKIFLWAKDIGSQIVEHKIKGKTPSGMLKFKYGIAKKLVFSKLKEKTGGRLWFFISGGAPLGKEIAEFFLAADLTILEGYGLTETSPVITVNTFDKIKPGTVGLPLPNVQIKIAEDGEILCKGPNVMRGYYKKPEATKEAIDPDGWFHTGDIGMIDEDGFLVITDRKKEIIVTSGGKNVAPQPIENALKASKYITQAVLIGDKRKYISALIVPDFDVLTKWAKQNGIDFKSNEDLIEKQLVKDLIQKEVDKVNHDLARYEQVKKFALLPHELTQDGGELTPTLKLKRRVINEKYKDIIDSLYAE